MLPNVTFSGILSSNAKHPVWINQQERIIYVSAMTVSANSNRLWS